MIRAATKSPSKTSTAPVPVGKHLVVDPAVCHGELSFRGTRVPVRTILLTLAKGRSLAYLRESWPEVSPEAIEEAVSLAADLLAHRYRDGKP